MGEVGRGLLKMSEIVQHSEYRDWLIHLKQQIKTGQIKAALSVNSQLIMLYWDLGRQIVEKQENAQWGSGFIEQLSKDLREEFPEMTGFSRTNLFRMKRFYQFYAPIVQENELIPQVGGQLIIPQVGGQLEMTDKQIVAQVVGQLQVAFNQQNINVAQLVPKLLSIPWRHNVVIIEKVNNVKEALFYINKTIENNWSRSVLEYQIETDLYNRQGKAITNFSTTLPAPQSDLANELMKDPYNFDFLQSVRIASLGRKKCQPQALHSVRNAPNIKKAA